MCRGMVQHFKYVRVGGTKIHFIEIEGKGKGVIGRNERKEVQAFKFRLTNIKNF